MNFLKFIYVLFLVSILGCSKNSKSHSPITKSSIKQKIEQLKQLGTVEYTLSKVLKIDDNDWYTIGDRKALINLKAYLVAGIDFQKIEVTDFESDNYIKLSMPKAEIILLNIPPDEIYFSLLKSSYFRSEFSNEELNEIQILGEEEVVEKIKDLGILLEAENNAKIFLNSWLKLLGFKQVFFNFNVADSEYINNKLGADDTTPLTNESDQLVDSKKEDSYLESAKKMIDSVIN